MHFFTCRETELPPKSGASPQYQVPDKRYVGMRLDPDTVDSTVMLTFDANGRCPAMFSRVAECLIQFILLLGLFVKPMLIRVEGTQSGGALYRRVVMRNIVCTTGTVISYAITSVVIVVTLSIESSANDSVRQELSRK